MNEHNEEAPEDLRHNTPPVNPFAGDHIGNDTQAPFFALPELGKAQAYSSESWVAPEIELSHGLTWTFAPGHKLMDLGRLGTDAIESMHTLDLRVILAHLDSAAQAITAELRRR